MELLFLGISLRENSGYQHSKNHELTAGIQVNQDRSAGEY